MAETLEAITAAIEAKRAERPARPEPFILGSPAASAFYAALETWAREMDSLQAKFNGTANRMVFTRQAPTARTFTHAPMRFRQ